MILCLYTLEYQHFEGCANAEWAGVLQACTVGLTEMTGSGCHANEVRERFGGEHKGLLERLLMRAGERRCERSNQCRHFVSMHPHHRNVRAKFGQMMWLGQRADEPSTRRQHPRKLAGVTRGKHTERHRNRARAKWEPPRRICHHKQRTFVATRSQTGGIFCNVGAHEQHARVCWCTGHDVGKVVTFAAAKLGHNLVWPLMGRLTVGKDVVGKCVRKKIKIASIQKCTTCMQHLA